MPVLSFTHLPQTKQGCKERILALQAESQSAMSSTVFRRALHPDLEKDQPRLDLTGLSADALLFFVAGTDTTAWALTTGT
jgi:cytochrome P450